MQTSRMDVQMQRGQERVGRIRRVASTYTQPGVKELAGSRCGAKEAQPVRCDGLGVG